MDNIERKRVGLREVSEQMMFRIGWKHYMQGVWPIDYSMLPDRREAFMYESGRQVAATCRAVGIREESVGKVPWPRINTVVLEAQKNGLKWGPL